MQEVKSLIEKEVSKRKSLESKVKDLELTIKRNAKKMTALESDITALRSQRKNKKSKKAKENQPIHESKVDLFVKPNEPEPVVDSLTSKFYISPKSRTQNRATHIHTADV